MSKYTDAADFALQAGKPSCDSNTFLKKFLGLWGSVVGEIHLDAWEFLFCDPASKMLVFPAREVHPWSSSICFNSH